MSLALLIRMFDWHNATHSASPVRLGLLLRAHRSACWREIEVDVFPSFFVIWDFSIFEYGVYRGASLLTGGVLDFV